MYAGQVHWTESRSTGTRLGAYTEHYNAEVEYFFKRQVLFGGGTSCHFCSAMLDVDLILLENYVVWKLEI